MACLFPITIRNPAYYDHTCMQYIPVPCRKCPACLRARTNNWVFRLLQEDKIHERSYFVTLTYDSKTVPITDKGFMSLNKRDLQLFFKRLRKNVSKTHKSTIKYYACGEYGSKTFRPHYHVILFGATISDIEQAWSVNGNLIGLTHCDKVNGASIAYTAKYMNKGKLIPMHSNDDRLPEFQLTSQKMGMNYLTPAMVQYHLINPTNRNFVTLEGGVKMAMPTAYRKAIFTADERERQAKAIQESIMAKQIYEEEQFRLAHPHDNYYRVLNERKKAAVAVFRDRLKQRSKV